MALASVFVSGMPPPDWRHWKSDREMWLPPLEELLGQRRATAARSSAEELSSEDEMTTEQMSLSVGRDIRRINEQSGPETAVHLLELAWSRVMIMRQERRIQELEEQFELDRVLSNRLNRVLEEMSQSQFDFVRQSQFDVASHIQ